jgi:predicted transglutaminase-like protease
MINEMKKSAPKIVQNVLKNEYIFLFKIYHCNVLPPINKIIINIYLINYLFFLVLFYQAKPR